MISSSEYENSIIQNYSKNLLEILELCINECETSTLVELGYGPVSMEDIERDLIRRDDDQMLLLRITVYQQLQFELLERIRMYKKYVCEGDKIFMEFD